MENYFFEDFTEAGFKELLVLAKRNRYRFITSDQLETKGRVIFWRHDVDFSVHRAFKLAQIEAEEGIRATYFINLHSDSYHAFEKEITELIRKILALKHSLGLHFDLDFTESDQTRVPLEEQIGWESQLLQKTFGLKPAAVSFHNPEVTNPPDDDVICEMVNMYGRTLKKNFSYCSDSNGYWRHRRLKDVLEKAEDERLHVLTHPEWWVPQTMSPRQRISRCIDGRASKQHKQYDALLDRCSRKNIP